IESCYYHTSAALVAIGDRVARGQPIALVGMTGATTGPHGHWEGKENGRIIDPLSHYRLAMRVLAALVAILAAGLIGMAALGQAAPTPSPLVRSTARPTSS